MVMFREDEQRIIAAERAAQPRWRKWLRRGIKTVLVLTGFFILSLFMLNGLASRSEALKKGLEQYISQTSGLKADIGTLSGVMFFPMVALHFEDMALSQPSGARVGSLSSFSVAMGFWDLFFSRHRFYALDMRDLNLDAVTIRRLHLDRAGYKGGPGLVVDARYGNEPVVINIAMAIKNGRTFAMPRHAGFTASVGPLRAEGVISHKRGQGLVLDFTTLQMPGASAGGSLSIGRTGDRTDMMIDLKTGQSVLKADMHGMSGGGLQGAVDMQRLAMRDIDPLLDLVASIVSRWPEAMHKITDLDVKVGQVDSGDQTLGRFDFTLHTEPGRIQAKDFNGTAEPALSALINNQGLLLWHRDGLDIALPLARGWTCLEADMGIRNSSILLNPLKLSAAGQGYKGRAHVGGAQSSLTLSADPSVTACAP